MAVNQAEIIKTAVEKAGILNKRLVQLFEFGEPLQDASTNKPNCVFCEQYSHNDHLMSCVWQQAKLAFEDMKKYSGLFEN